MNDDSSQSTAKSTLRAEWSLLLESFIEDEQTSDKKIIEGLPLDFIQDQMRDLSEQKQYLFQQIESIKIEIDQTYSVIDNLKLVGSDTQAAYARIDELEAKGHQLTEYLGQLDQKIRKIRTLAG